MVHNVLYASDRLNARILGGVVPVVVHACTADAAREGAELRVTLLEAAVAADRAAARAALKPPPPKSGAYPNICERVRHGQIVWESYDCHAPCGTKVQTHTDFYAAVDRLDRSRRQHYRGDFEVDNWSFFDEAAELKPPELVRVDGITEEWVRIRAMWLASRAAGYSTMCCPRGHECPFDAPLSCRSTASLLTGPAAAFPCLCSGWCARILCFAEVTGTQLTCATASSQHWPTMACCPPPRRCRRRTRRARRPALRPPAPPPLNEMVTTQSLLRCPTARGWRSRRRWRSRACDADTGTSCARLQPLPRMPRCERCA